MVTQKTTWSDFAVGILILFTCVCCSGDPTANEADADEHKKIYINEIMASNTASISDEFGEYDDWIELYNDEDTDVNLLGYSISDDPERPLQTALSGELTIPAKGMLLLWADKDPEQGSNHLPFNLKRSGEAVILTAPNGVIMDSFDWIEAVTDHVFARFPDGTGEFARCDRLTPGELNGLACYP